MSQKQVKLAEDLENALLAFEKFYKLKPSAKETGPAIQCKHSTFVTLHSRPVLTDAGFPALHVNLGYCCIPRCGAIVAEVIWNDHGRKQSEMIPLYITDEKVLAYIGQSWLATRTHK